MKATVLKNNIKVGETGVYIVDQVETDKYKLNEVFHNPMNTANYDQIGGVYPTAELCDRIRKYCSPAADAFTVLIEYSDLKRMLAAGAGS